MQLDYVHLLEIIVVALIGIGGWLWRLGRKEQQQEDRISRLEQWRESVGDEVRGEIGRVEREAEDMSERLNRIEERQQEQDVVLARIEANQASQKEVLNDLKKDIRQLAGAARSGGNWHCDPSGGQP